VGKKIILIDVGKCIGCRACEVACEKFNGTSKITVFELEDILTMPLNCRHCEKAPCMSICPTNALYTDEDGAVLLSPLKCIGCMMCAIVCPFGIPEFDELNKVMMKCDLCRDRRAMGLLPACVATCPTDALVYGEVNEVLLRKREYVAQKAIILSKEVGEILLK